MIKLFYPGLAIILTTLFFTFLWIAISNFISFENTVFIALATIFSAVIYK